MYELAEYLAGKHSIIKSSAKLTITIDNSYIPGELYNTILHKKGNCGIYYDIWNMDD